MSNTGKVLLLKSSTARSAIRTTRHPGCSSIRMGPCAVSAVPAKRSIFQKPKSGRHPQGGSGISLLCSPVALARSRDHTPFFRHFFALGPKSEILMAPQRRNNRRRKKRALRSCYFAFPLRPPKKHEAQPFRFSLAFSPGPLYYGFGNPTCGAGLLAGRRRLRSGSQQSFQEKKTGLPPAPLL